MIAIELAGSINLNDVDFNDPRTFDNPFAVYKAARDLETLHYDAKNNIYIAPRHEDVFHISRNSTRYISGKGVRPVVAGDMSIITLDGEEHIRTRRLINNGFTPRRIRELMPHIRDLTNGLIDDIKDKGHVDFVEDFAIHVPLIIICELMGLNPEQRMKMYRWSDDMMAGDGHSDPDSPILHGAAVAFGEFAEMCLELIAERRANPQDDLISLLTQVYDEGGLAKAGARPGVSEEDQARHKELHGDLSDDDLLAFLAVLLVAGNETTRNGIAGGVLALSLFPEQQQRFVAHLKDDEYLDKAVEELIRFVSPVIGFIRTVTEDHTYRGTDLKEGDRVLMLYQSANRDERVFDRPDELDLERSPNPHLAFGIGQHLCLGASLARTEVKLVLQELYSRIPDLHIDDDAPFARAASSLVIGLEHLPASFTPGGCPVAH